jgi:hypothetical protein
MPTAFPVVPLPILWVYCLLLRPSPYPPSLPAYLPGLLPVLEAYCPLPLLQTYCLSSRPTASRPIAYHPGLPPIFQAYCLTCRSGAYPPGLLPILNAYCLSSRPTACLSLDRYKLFMPPSLCPPVYSLKQL